MASYETRTRDRHLKIYEDFCEARKAHGEYAPLICKSVIATEVAEKWGFSSEYISRVVTRIEKELDGEAKNTRRE